MYHAWSEDGNILNMKHFDCNSLAELQYQEPPQGVTTIFSVSLLSNLFL